jgi:glycosyltransferase involved in cell wall biosynthesis
MKQQKYHIIYLGISGFPERIMAANQKTKMICRALKNDSFEVTVINRRGVFPKAEKIKSVGEWNGIAFTYASGSPYRHPNMLIRRLMRWKGLLNEFFLIRKLNRKSKINAAIIYDRFFLNILLYKFYSRLIGFPIIVSYVEYLSSLPDTRKLLVKLNAFFFDRYTFKLADAALPTSDFLIRHVRQVNPDIPILKIPAISDFEPVLNINEVSHQKYFVFCGYLEYFEIIIFIIDAFDLVTDGTVQLHLILNGDPGKMKIVKAKIERSLKKEKILVFSSLAFESLFEKYRNAIGLLIPLRPTIQDIARFPFKIAEYVASCTPIITTNYGVIREYFDNTSAIIAKEYSIVQYAERMNFVIENPEIAKSVGECAHKIGLLKFNYKNYGPSLRSLILNM